MSDLWAPKREEALTRVAPLAARVRPASIDQVVGQTHILGEGKLLRRMIDADTLTSIILHGPPGTGKTTLAEVIAKATSRRFVRENAASVGVKRIREIIDEASRILGEQNKRTILFLDEIHRFSKSQQDVLLADVERGLITLIGATTENPLFAVNAALISRSTLFRLESLTEDETVQLIDNALKHPSAFPDQTIEVTPDAKRVWAIKSEGDARRALTALEVAVRSSIRSSAHGLGNRRRDPVLDQRPDHRRDRGDLALGQQQRPGTIDEQEAGSTPTTQVQAQTGTQEATLVIDKQLAEDSIQQKVATYGDDGHYDTISAMIKSVRGSDPDAAVYWIARMLDAGEDPRFIARRLAILASEDIGNADPRGIMIAQAAWDLVERIGMPEARITLSQCATYLACAPKSNAAYMAINAAMDDVKNGRVIPVPIYLRDGNTSPRSSGDGSGQRVRDLEDEKYQYSHNAEDQLTGQDYLGVDKRYYEPKDIGSEKILKAFLEEARAKKDARKQK
ncbi:MAG: replication-associated recombination protein A [Phycisphaerales bacterium JB052]